MGRYDKLRGDDRDTIWRLVVQQRNACVCLQNAIFAFYSGKLKSLLVDLLRLGGSPALSILMATIYMTHQKSGVLVNIRMTSA